ncbi:MAG: hypothetical protein ACJAUG_000596 [Halioglobus sp.]|jgi:hypothetical protein
MKYLLLLTVLLLSPVMMAKDIEEPRWELITKLGAVEIRQYEPSIHAVTRLSSSGETSQGFRRLAGYIFGGNEQSQSIAMTAPVQETLAPETPEMSFTLPAEYALEDLPVPDDDSIFIRPVPGKTVATIGFSGWATDGKVARQTTELLSVLEQNAVTVIGVPILNQYNPPWTVPFLRRNEIAVEIQWSPEIEVSQ